MKRLLRYGAISGAVLAASAAEGFDGTYHGQLNGEPALATISTRDSTVTGVLDIGGYSYRLEAHRAGDRAEGQLYDQAGNALPLSLQRETGRLTVRVEASGTPLTVVLTVASGEGAGDATTTASPGEERDPALIGAWAKRESYTSGDFSMVDETTVQLLPDGTYRFGPGRVIGGGNAGTFDSGAGGDGGAGGRWRTADRILYMQEAGTGWTPYGKYYVEGNKALITFGDGSRELWSRR